MKTQGLEFRSAQVRHSTPSSALRDVVGNILTSYAIGIRALFTVPAILAIVAVPELVQHAVEMHIGMLDSLRSARALQYNPERLGVGIVKVGATFITPLVLARLWATSRVDTRFFQSLSSDFGWFLVGLGGVFGSGLVLDPLIKVLPERVQFLATLAAGFPQSLLFFWAIGRILADNTVSPLAVVRHMKLDACVFIFTFLASFPVMIGLHYALNKLILGWPHYVIWLPLAIDALIIIPASAGVTGASLYIGYYGNRRRLPPP